MKNIIFGIGSLLIIGMIVKTWSDKNKEQMSASKTNSNSKLKLFTENPTSQESVGMAAPGVNGFNYKQKRY